MYEKVKPPDKYRCIKLPIQKILKSDLPIDVLERINDAVSRTNIITTNSYFLLRLWVLQKYHNNQEIPIITEDTIRMSMKSLVKASAGPKPKGNNLALLQEFQNIGNSIFTLQDSKNLSAILDYYATTMITAIENNIKIHFIDYIKRFINSYFKNIYQNELQNKEFKKQFYKELQQVKNDIINDAKILTCDEKYHNWLNDNRYKIVPENYDTSYFYDIKVNPQKYLKHMIFMNLQLEEMNTKMFQFFPLQTHLIPRHIQIDTKSIVELLIDTDKKQYFDNIETNKEKLWNTFFKLHHMNKYVFDYTIITDGYSVSLRFLHTDFVNEERIKKDKMKNGKKLIKGLTEEEKEIKKQEKQVQQNKLKEENRKRRELQKKEKKEKKETKKEVLHEFPYIDEVSKDFLDGKHLFIDPGKRTLLQMMDDDGNYFSYTNKQRIKETKRIKYSSLLKNYKDKQHITEIENTLSLFNSKTCDIEKFKEYIKEKLKVNDAIAKLYQDEKFRKYKWYSYINTKRTEDNMLNKIENKYGKDIKIIIGDWSIGKQMRNFISTPNLSIKRKLNTRFEVYNIDEFRTSCLNYKTEELCNNLYLPDKKNIERKMHSILTFKMENKRKGCINRDKNGCKNIQKIFNHYIETGERPEKYKRDYKFQ